MWGFLGKFVGIHNATRMGNIGLIKDLLRKNPALVNARDETGQTPLHCAIGYFELGVVEALLAHGADVSAQDNKGVTPLHILAAGVPPNPPPPPKSVRVGASGLKEINLKIAELLLHHRADPYVRTAWGWTPLETAQQANTSWMVSLLRRYETAGAPEQSGYMRGASNVPWDEVGKALGSTLLKDVDEATSRLLDSAHDAPDILADLRSPTWRYEFAIFHMFWVWYIANAPRLENAGATKPLLDAFHRQCYSVLREARLIESGTAAFKVWQTEIEKRVLTYRSAYEATNSGPEASLRIYAGTVGYELLRFLDPDKEPSGLAVIVNEIGQLLFIELAKYIQRLEERYSST